MRLPPILKIPVVLATAAPLLAFLIPGCFMAAVGLGLWDYLARYLNPRVIESIGWSLAMALAWGFGALQFALTLFYLLHITTNRAFPPGLRIIFAAGILLVPLLSMTVYCLLCILPDQPPVAPSGTHLPQTSNLSHVSTEP